jgi:GDPmannose 4,6-dehydratase
VRVLITGATGQDGPYLARQLIEAGNEVYGLVRGQMSPKWGLAEAEAPGLRLIRGDLADQSSLQAALLSCEPDVVYNLAALSFVGTSWLQPAITADITGTGALRLLDAIRFTRPQARFVQASSSEMYGQAALPVSQDEFTSFAPRSPYAVAKVFAHHITVNYRESYGLHASCAIMFNHESPRRGEEFVTRKVTLAAARIAAGSQAGLALGRLDPQRDWGWAPEYMTALPLIAARDEPGDYVLATGATHTVAEWCEAAFAVAGLDWKDHVRSDAALYRPAEVEYLRGDAGRAKRELGWEALVSFGDIARRMTEHDMNLVRHDAGA